MWMEEQILKHCGKIALCSIVCVCVLLDWDACFFVLFLFYDLIHEAKPQIVTIEEDMKSPDMNVDEGKNPQTLWNSFE